MMKNLVIIILSLLIYASCKKEGHAPVITLLGKNPAETGAGYPYHDAGATANDEEDGDITSKIIVQSTVDTSKTGTYQVTYNVTDSDGQKAVEVKRVVIVKYFK
jgi:hypothetical protein